MILFCFLYLYIFNSNKKFILEHLNTEVNLLQKEKDHVEGFAPECLIANIGGGQKIDDPLSGS